MPNTIEIGICTKSDAFALPPCAMRTNVVNKTMTKISSQDAPAAVCLLLNPKADALCYAGCSFANNAVRQPCKHVDSLSLIIAYLLPLDCPKL